MRAAYWWLLIILLAFVLRIPGFINPIIDEDEAWYATAANVMNQNGVIYKDAVDLKPPLLFYCYSSQFLVFGNDMRVFHFITTFWVLLTAFFIFKATKLLVPEKRAAYLAALLYVLFSPTFVPKALATNTEILMNLPLVAGFYLILKAEKRGTSQSVWIFLFFVSGAICCLAALIKYQAGIGLPIIIGYLLIINPFYLKSTTLKKGIVGSSLILAGSLFILAVLFLEFQRLGNWDDFYFWGWQYNFQFMSGFTWSFFVKKFFAFTPRFILSWILLFFAASKRIKNLLTTKAASNSGEYLIAVWLLGSILAVCAGGKFFGHYYIQLLPPLTILAGIELIPFFTQPRTTLKRKLVYATALFGMIAPPLIYLGTNCQGEQKRMSQENQPLIQIADLIQDQTDPHDKIFIWGRVPELYYFSNRLPASRFITCNFLVGMTSYNYHLPRSKIIPKIPEHAWASFMADLQKNKPQIILDTAVSNYRNYGKYALVFYPQLKNFIDNDYQPGQVINQQQIYIRKAD